MKIGLKQLGLADIRYDERLTRSDDLVYCGLRYCAASAWLRRVGAAGNCGNLRLSLSVQDNDCSATHLQKRGEDVHDIGERNLQLRGRR